MLGEGIFTSQIMWVDWVAGSELERAVVSGVEDNKLTYVCRCFVHEINNWVAGKLVYECIVEWYGKYTCINGQVQVYVGCEGLNCPNDIPAKCEHNCPNA